jgi:transposase-like protein
MTPSGRQRMVRAVLEGQPVRTVADRFAVDAKTVRKWVGHFQDGGAAGVADRSSHPRRSPAAIVRGTVQRVVSLRRTAGP